MVATSPEHMPETRQEVRKRPSPDNSRTPSRNTCISLRDEWVGAPILRVAEVHLVPARDFPSGRGRPTTAMPGASQKRSDDVSGGKDPRDGRSRSWIMRAGPATIVVTNLLHEAGAVIDSPGPTDGRFCERKKNETQSQSVP